MRVSAMGDSRALSPAASTVPMNPARPRRCRACTISRCPRGGSPADSPEVTATGRPYESTRLTGGDKSRHDAFVRLAYDIAMCCVSDSLPSAYGNGVMLLPCSSAQRGDHRLDPPTLSAPVHLPRRSPMLSLSRSAPLFQAPEALSSPGSGYDRVAGLPARSIIRSLARPEPHRGDCYGSSPPSFIPRLTRCRCDALPLGFGR